MKISELYNPNNTLTSKIWFLFSMLCIVPFIGFLPSLIATIFAKAKGYGSRPALLTAGIVCIAWNSMEILILLLTGTLTMSPAVFFVFLASVIAGIIVVILHFSMEKGTKFNDKIYSLIYVDHILNVKRISEILGVNKNTVVKSINKMISDNVIRGTVNHAQTELILFNSIWAHQLCVCNNCGAEISVNLGDTLTCPYCSSALSVKF